MDEMYEVRKRPSDKKWCIYLRKYNVVIAVFVDGCNNDAQKIRKILEGMNKGK
jgi:hypothetical protein